VRRKNRGAVTRGARTSFKNYFSSGGDLPRQQRLSSYRMTTRKVRGTRGGKSPAVGPTQMEVNPTRGQFLAGFKLSNMGTRRDLKNAKKNGTAARETILTSQSGGGSADSPSAALSKKNSPVCNGRAYGEPVLISS